MVRSIESPPGQRSYRFLDLITVAFSVVLVLSNIASSAKLIDWGTSILNLPLAFDAGTVFFPIAYIFGDVLTEVYGYANNRRVIWIGFIALVFTFLMFLVIQQLPGESSWQNNVGQEAYNKILGGISSGGIVLASLLGYLGGSFSNAMLMALLKHITQGRILWFRTIGSTIVGEFADTVIFVTIASIAHIFPWNLFWTLTVTNYLFKVSVEVAMTPVTYWVTGKLKKIEKLDVFSNIKNLNPLSF